MSLHAPVTELPLFAPPPRVAEEEKGREAVAAAAEPSGKANYLRMVRARMRAIYRSRVGAYGADHPRACVRPDDARAYFETLNPPAGMSRNFLGAVFREPGWTVVGEYRSGTDRSHGNKLNEYRWTG